MDPSSPGQGNFALVRKGYDRAQVDDRLRFLGAELASAEHALGAAHDRADAAEKEIKRLKSELTRVSEAEPTANFGDRVERILRLAEEEAAEMRTKAQAEADTIISRARAKSDALVEEAEGTAQRRERAAKQEVDRLTALRVEAERRLSALRSLLDQHFPVNGEKPSAEPIQAEPAPPKPVPQFRPEPPKPQGREPQQSDATRMLPKQEQPGSDRDPTRQFPAGKRT